MSQSDQFHEVWAQLRDYARPVVPDDVAQLEVVRTFHPPSKAHRHRLAKARPEVSPSHPLPPADTTARLRANELIRLRNETRAELRRLAKRR